MPCYYAPLKLILIFFIILSNGFIKAAKNRTTNIGVIVDEGSRAGKERKTAIEIAVRELNSGSKNHKLAVHFKNYSGDPFQAASSANELIDEQNVRVIIGTDSWDETTFVASTAQRAQVPIMSLSTVGISQPLSRARWPFLVQMTNQDVYEEINCIASMVQSYNWKRVILVYEDDVYGGGYGALASSLLSDSLQKVGSEIEHRLVVPNFPSFDLKETIRDEIAKILTTKQSRVFIVLKSSVDTTTRVFEEAKRYGLTGRDSVWILGNGFSNVLDSVNSSVFTYMQGALGIKTYFSDKNTDFQDFKSRFRTSFRSSYPDEDKLEPGIDAIRAYDSVNTVSRALESLGTFNESKTTFSKDLLNSILSSNFSGLTGSIAFHDRKLSQPLKFTIVNVVGKSYKELGFWTSESGFSNDHGMKLLAINWPGDLVSRFPKGWAMPSEGKRLQIGVPDETSLDRFVKVEWIESTNETRYTGFCIDVFEAVVATLEAKHGYTLPYEFVNHTGLYDNMVDEVYYKNYDAVVGDVTILANRSKYVEFTQPFTESGLLMVVPVKPEPQKAWKFMKPFTIEMWLATLSILIYTMFVVWFIEHQENEQFRGPWKDQLGTALWFTFSSLFYAHREKIQSNYSKVVVMMWLFVVFILTASYTASLTSMLTVRMLEPTVRDIEWLRKTNAPVGCDPDSFVGKYLKDVLKLKNVKNISRQYEYPDNFKSGNIVAAFLELPYEKVFLRENCGEYTSTGPAYKFGGLGFVFQKGSPFTEDVSEAILSLLEDGKIRELENEWLFTSRNCSNSDSKMDSESLSLDSFWGIFLISGLISTSCLGVFLYRHLSHILNRGWRWRKAMRIIQIVLRLNDHNQVMPREERNHENPSNFREEWNHRNPPRWELVSPTEVPEHLEIGRPTQLEIPMRKLEHVGED